MNKRPEILAILARIQDTHYQDVSNPVTLLEYGFELAGYISFTGEACAEAKSLLHKAKEKAAISVMALLEAQGKKIIPSLVKDYILDKCGEQSAYLTLCERCNACCTHTLEFVRSALSYLKTEINNSQYAT